MTPTHFLKNQFYPHLLEIYCLEKNKIFHLIDCKEWVEVTSTPNSFISDALLLRMKKSFRRLDNLRGDYFFSSIPYRDCVDPYLNKLPTIFKSGCTIKIKNPLFTKSNLNKLLCGSYNAISLDDQYSLVFNPNGKEMNLKKNIVANVFNPLVQGPALMMKTCIYEKLRI